MQQHFTVVRMQRREKQIRLRATAESESWLLESDVCLYLFCFILFILLDYKYKSKCGAVLNDNVLHIMNPDPTTIFILNIML